jgi:hypothetical protein
MAVEFGVNPIGLGRVPMHPAAVRSHSRPLRSERNDAVSHPQFEFMWFFRNARQEKRSAVLSSSLSSDTDQDALAPGSCSLSSGRRGKQIYLLPRLQEPRKGFNAQLDLLRPLVACD